MTTKMYAILILLTVFIYFLSVLVIVPRMLIMIPQNTHPFIQTKQQLILSYPTQSWVREQVRLVLSFLHLKVPTFNNWNTVSDKAAAKSYYCTKSNIIYTGIPKSGCTNWKLILMDYEEPGYDRDNVHPQIQSSRISQRKYEENTGRYEEYSRVKFSFTICITITYARARLRCDCEWLGACTG